MIERNPNKRFNLNIKKMNEKIIIPKLKHLTKTINLIKQDWASQIHVLSDFDKTLTKAFVDEKPFPSIISELRNKNYLWENYSEKANELYDFYHPIEIDPVLPFQEKFEKMDERRNKHINLLIQSWLNKKHIEGVVRTWRIQLREWGSDFFDLLEKNNIPLVIISGSWLGESIPLFFQEKWNLSKNIDIITNFFERDDNGFAIWHKIPVIHTLNKSEVILNQFPFYDKVKNRKNVILLWDALEDTWMVEWFEYKNLIKIWFLNENIDNQLEFFKEKYDVIILNDGSMEYVNNLLKEII